MTDIHWSGIETRQLSELTHWDINPRYSDDDARERLRKSKAKFDQTYPILIGPNDELYDGHQRALAWAEEHGDLEVEVRKCSRVLTLEERQELTIVHHAAAMGEWDFPALEAWGVDDKLLDWGFDAEAMDWFEPEAEETPEPAEAQIDKASELLEKWNVKTGQIWRLGEHRVVCGDCTDKAVVDAVMGGLTADAVITDPPYLTTDLDFDKSLDFAWVDIALEVVQDNGYLCAFGPYEVQFEIISRGFLIRFTGMWLKDRGGMRTHNAKKPMCQSEPYVVFAHPQHKVSELVYNKVFRDGYDPYTRVQNNTGKKRAWQDQIDRANTSTWTQDGYISTNDGTRQATDVLFSPAKNGMKHSERTIHPTQKPLEVIQTQIEWLTNETDVVLEPFLGSGTTLIACQALNRQCIAVEISPAYVAVTLERFYDTTGIMPTLEQ
jgi:DNA modification methylase